MMLFTNYANTIMMIAKVNTPPITVLCPSFFFISNYTSLENTSIFYTVFSTLLINLFIKNIEMNLYYLNLMYLL